MTSFPYNARKCDLTSVKLFYLLLFLACGACNYTVTTRLVESTDWVILEDTGESTNCLSSDNFKIDSTHLRFWPIKYVRLGLHVMDKTSRPFSFDSITGPKKLENLVALCNSTLSKRQRLNLPKDNNFPPTTTRMRYVVAPDVDPSKKGIYFHYDEEMPYHIHKGKGQNRGDGQIFKKYAYRNDSILNVFFISPPPDSVANPDFKIGTPGVAFGSRYIKLIGPWHDFTDSWPAHKSFIHEVGHIYTLNHAWLKNDGCDDTPPHKNCWNINIEKGCLEVSNNIMDYSSRAIALSPCQVGRMHAVMAREGSKQRAYLQQNWCRGKNINVDLRDTFILRHATDLEGSLTLHPGAYLELRCRLSIPQGHRITVMPGATLALAGGKLHNSCGLDWEGLFVEEFRRKRGSLLLLGDGTIENAKGGAILPEQPATE